MNKIRNKVIDVIEELEDTLDGTTDELALLSPMAVEDSADMDRLQALISLTESIIESLKDIAYEEDSLKEQLFGTYIEAHNIKTGEST